MVLLYILLGLAGVIVFFLLLAAAQPAGFRIVRSGKINAPPAAVFPHVNDFHNWQHWSPWAKIDPAMQQTYDGPASGVGAKYSWLGNKKVGEGRMTITDSQPSELIRINLEFLKPFAATNTTEFTFQPEGDGTLVTWSMAGTKNFMFKAMGLLMSIDKMIGRDFEKGLASMKAVVAGAK